MRMLVTVALMTGILTIARADDAKPITPAEAIKQIGKPKVVVEMVFKKAKDRLEKRGIIYLDSEGDFKDEKNLGVAILAEAAAKYTFDNLGQQTTLETFADSDADFVIDSGELRGKTVQLFDERG